MVVVQEQQNGGACSDNSHWLTYSRAQVEQQQQQQQQQTVDQGGGPCGGGRLFNHQHANDNPEQARANLLDSMLASSTSSSETEADSDTADEEYKYQHLHELHRVRRLKIASNRDQCVVRYIPPPRPSILDRKDFYFRYGEKEQEAVASFDFLETMSTSVSDIGSAELLSEKGVGGSRCVVTEDNNGSMELTSANKLKKNSSKRSTTLSYESDENRNCGGGGSLHSKTASLDDKMVECRSLLLDSGRGSSQLHDICNEMKLSAQTLTSHEDADERLSLSDSCAESFSCSGSNLHLEI